MVSPYLNLDVYIHRINLIIYVNLCLDYKKYQQDRKELILIRRSFASFVVVKRQEDGRKNPFVAHFKPAKKKSFQPF